MGPVRRCPSPTYPTRLQAGADPTLLAHHVPPGWLVEGMAAATAVLLASSTAGCGAGTKNAEPPIATPSYRPRPQAKRTVPAGAVVAPLFRHGEGRGAWGCIAISPPSFIPEDEALQVIREELGRARIVPRQRVVWNDVVMPKLEGEECERTPAAAPGAHTEPLAVDGVDPELRVAFKYVTLENYGTLGGALSGSSVQCFDFGTVSQSVGAAVRERRREPVFFAMLYDPAITPRESEKMAPGRELDEIARLKCADRFLDSLTKWRCNQAYYRAQHWAGKRLLRQQVRDFVEWLKAQGAI